MKIEKDYSVEERRARRKMGELRALRGSGCCGQ